MPKLAQSDPSRTTMVRPTQAVILAGGRGTRLAPLTDTCPKPMIKFHGKPFLEYLIELLREQGFKRILLLLGYRPEAIKDYFGDGSRWGVSIEYSISPVDDDTGRRVKLARSRLDPIFMLMYCDNYWPMDFDAMWNQFKASDSSALVTVYRNNHGYTKSNLSVDEEGFVTLYDKSRQAPNLSGVDIGFVILKDSVVDILSNENISFEAVVYPKLVAQRQLQGYLTEHRYYSVGSHERLALTTEFLAQRPTVLLDRDGVLNQRMPQAKYVCSWGDWEWLPGAKNALTLLKDAGYRIIIISNQPGIARQELTESDLAYIHQNMKDDVVASGGHIDAIYYCPHGWDDGCECRKPRPGLLFRAQRDFSIDLTRTYFVGDDERDGQAAAAAGCPFIRVDGNASLLDATKIILQRTTPPGKDLECQNAY